MIAPSTKPRNLDDSWHNLNDSWTTNRSWNGDESSGTNTPVPSAPAPRLPSYYPQELLGPGPMRFAPHEECDLEKELLRLHRSDGHAYDRLQRRWNEYCADKERKRRARKGKGSKLPASTNTISMEWLFRFLRHTARKDGSFNEDRAFRAMTKCLTSDRFLKLRVFSSSLTKQLESKTLFPVPGLKTKDNFDMFYMKPARYFPKQTLASTIIDNLVYVMNTVLEKEHAQKEGIGFIACMDEWRFENFEVNYCYKFMMALQGAMVPVKVQLFLIVNPPAWFGAIWRIMKPMLAPSFRRKVKICHESTISKYLQADYRRYLPDDFATGQASTEELVADFVTYRRYVERGDDLVGYSEGEQSCNSEYEDDEDTIDLVSNNDNDSQHGSDTASSCASDDDDDASINADIDKELLEEIDREIERDFLDTGW
jgi:hypothetical protein